jgi:UPF0755 protein
MLRHADRFVWFRRAVFAGWLIGTGFLTFQLIIFPSRPGPGPNKDAPFFIEQDDDLESVARRLHAERAIDDPASWLRFMRLFGAEKTLKRGWVPINRALSAKDLLARILDLGLHPLITVNIPEGFNRFDVATRLSRFGLGERDVFLRLSEDQAVLARFDILAPSAEGYLFPATYQFVLNVEPRRHIERMLIAFRRRTAALFAELAQARARGEATITDHEALILASIVEKEARLADEQPVIAGVFLNRLNDPSFVPHRLQADPTVAYGCLVAKASAPTCSAFDGKRVTAAMVRDKDNPYNTYRSDGLPPGPIANPGLSALAAVVHPQVHDLFYFVATGGGRHGFSRTLDEHNARIRGAQ